VQSISVIEQEFLPLRAKLLEIAAALDRLDRVGVAAANEPRVTKIRAAIQVLLDDGEDHAEQIQLVFSRAYEEDWKEKLQISNFK
jgi:hypothetical protein